MRNRRRAFVPAAAMARLALPLYGRQASSEGHRMNSRTEASHRYDLISILLHWLTAALLLLAWTCAQLIDFFPKGSPRIGARSVHIGLGALLGAVLLARIGWRSAFGKHLPLAVSGLAGRAARAAHYALYLLLAATVILGIANVAVRGDQFFSFFVVPRIAPGNAQLKAAIENLHAWFANAVLILGGLHGLAALIHHYVLRDNVLRRMQPR
jgi:cytochrome b561